MIERIRHEVEQLQPQLRRMRHYLHAHPELSFQEHDTMRWIGEELTALGIPHRTRVAGTGVLATISGQGGPGSRCIALRADIDALPVQEQNACDYRSTRPGVMHACGHDVHTAMVLGAGAVLNTMRSEWRGTVVLVFQPGEEKIPGGASLLLKENAFEERMPDAILGQHVTPELTYGKLGFRSGPFMASSDELYVTVRGKGGHAAQPEKLIDPIMISARLLLQLKEEFATRCAGEKTVLAFGRVEAMGATNIIPNEVRIAGTLRAFSETLRNDLHTWLPERANAICQGMGGSCDFEVRKGYPVVVNDEALNARMERVAEALIGAENVVQMDQRMGSEDFAFYTHVMPGCFFRLGTGTPGEPSPRGLHTPTFDIDERALAIGCAMLVAGAVEELS